MELEEIAIGYAIQTNNLRINKKAIEEISLLDPKASTVEDYRLNLSRFRDSCIEDYREDYYEYNWCGWETCLCDSGIEFTKDEMILAKLLDEKRIFIRDRAKFKRLLYCAGNKLSKQ